MTQFAYAGDLKPETLTIMRDAWQRVLDFKERDRVLTSPEAMLVASQCGQCKTPSCGNHETQRKITRGTIHTESSTIGFALPQLRLDRLYACPMGNRIPDWEMAVQRGDFDEAFEIAIRTNLWADITGQVCPDGICETICNLKISGHWSGHIRGIERFIGDYGWSADLIAPLHIEKKLDQKIAIIGAGPSGFYPGHDLRSLGCQVTYFDANDVPGGLTTRGIPGMKIINQRILRHFQRLENAGVTFRMNTRVGSDIGFDEIAEQFDAVIIAMGAYNFKMPPGISGNGTKAIIHGIPFLKTQNQRDEGKTFLQQENDRHNAYNKHVIICGAGDTAFDVAASALRQQIDVKTCSHSGKITLLVRGDSMRAIEKEIKALKEEVAAISERCNKRKEDIFDIRFHSNLAYVDGDDAQISSVIIRSGDSTESLPAQMVIMAVGSQGVDLKSAFCMPNLNQNGEGMIHATPWKGRPGTRWQGGGLAGFFKSSTSEKFTPVYAVGDITRDGSHAKRRPLLVDALADGRDTVPDILHGFDDPALLLANNRDLILN